MIESVTDHIILIECNLCRGRWMVWVTRSHPSSMLPDHNTNSTKVTYLSTIRQSTVSRQWVSPLRSSTMFTSAHSTPLSNTTWLHMRTLANVNSSTNNYYISIIYRVYSMFYVDIKNLHEVRLSAHVYWVLSTDSLNHWSVNNVANRRFTNIWFENIQTNKRKILCSKWLTYDIFNQNRCLEHLGPWNS